MMRTWIKNGRIVTAGEVITGDILIENGIITTIAEQLSSENGDRIIDASGQYVLPGGIDVHTHLSNTELDDFESGTIAAAVGGTTSIINMTTPEPHQSVAEYLADWKRKAADSVIDYSFHYIISGPQYK